MKILIKNVYLIKESQDESLHLDDFYISSKTNIDKESIIDFLVSNDFIETDFEDNVFYLTPECYEYIDSNELKLAIFNKLDKEELELQNLDDFYEFSDKLNEGNQRDEIQINDEVSRNKAIQNTFYIILCLFIVAVLVGYFKNVTNKPEINQKVILNQDVMDDIKRITDSIIAVHREKSKIQYCNDELNQFSSTSCFDLFSPKLQS